MNELREKERLREEYHTYTKECRRKWQYQMTYEQWLAHQLIIERIQHRAEVERLQKESEG